ncbi:MAG: DUF2079 domain-containing protein [Myxococcota bacterium]
MSEPREREEPRPSPAEAEPNAEPSPAASESTGSAGKESTAATSQPAAPRAPEPDDLDEEDEEEDEEDEDDAEDEAADAEVSESKPGPTGPRPKFSELVARAVQGQAEWAPIARCLALGGLLGFAAAGWIQLGLSGRVASELLASNELPDGQRMMTLKVCLGAAAVGVAIVAYFVWNGFKKGTGMAPLERWMWFLSPLILAPAIASVLRFRPWVNAHERLLPITLVIAIVLEVLAFKALVAAPRTAQEWWRDAREQIPDIVRRRGPFVVVLLASVFYAVFFSMLLLRWHHKLKTGNFDLSINNNLIFGGLHGHFLESTVVFPQDPKKYLANHAKFGGYLLLPIYALYPRAETLLVMQSTFIGMSALPLWGFARRHISPWMATVVALAYLAYYPMHGASFSEFQYVPIAGFFVLGTIWAAEERRWVVFSIIFLTGLTLREDISIGMAVVGAGLLLSGHRPAAGLVMALISSIYFVVLRFYVMDSAGEWWFPNMYKELWADGERGFKSVIKTMLTNPLFVITKIFTEKKVWYLLHLFVPLAFLPARRWYLWLAFVPGLLLTLLVTNYDPPITFSFQYVMHWAPYLFAAAVLALEAIGKRPDNGGERRVAAALGMATASLVLSYNYGAFPQRDGSFRGGFHRVDFGISQAEEERYQNLQKLIAMIPKDASVAATEKLGPHVSSRVKMYTMRHGPQGAEYALASSRELKLSRTRPKLLEALRSGDYGVVTRIADMALLKRGYDTAENERLIRDWRLTEARPPTPSAAEPAPARQPEMEGAPPPPEEAPPEPRGPE